MKNNHAFIDSQNLNLSITGLGWKLDFKKFRKYLKDKYSVEKAYIFIGFVENNGDLYKFLQEVGYILIFRPTLKNKDGKIKGNCDSELVLHSVSGAYEELYEKAVIVSGDGDFYCLAEFLIKKNKLEKLLIPNRGGYSALFRRIPVEHLAFVSDLKEKLHK
ncbi:MAG: NYN domain-containing protein [Rickettsiales bacterium]|nr:NYN domain-containing protein [Rickettsiales bacterium]